MKNSNKKDETKSNSFKLLKALNLMVKRGEIKGYSMMHVDNPGNSGGITGCALLKK